jgi:hypothetical protein
VRKPLENLLLGRQETKGNFQNSSHGSGQCDYIGSKENEMVAF